MRLSAPVCLPMRESCGLRPEGRSAISKRSGAARLGRPAEKAIPPPTLATPLPPSAQRVWQCRELEERERKSDSSCDTRPKPMPRRKR